MEPKPLYLSKTVWGGIVIALSMVAAELEKGLPADLPGWIALLAKALGPVLLAIGSRDAVNKLQVAVEQPEAEKGPSDPALESKNRNGWGKMKRVDVSK